MNKIKSPTGNKLICKGWHQEAAYRMIQNNLDSDVAEDPDNLIVYGGYGKAARNWESYNKILDSLINLENEVIENIDFEEEGQYNYNQADKTVHQGIEFEIGYILNRKFQINWNAALSHNYFDDGGFDNKLLPKYPVQLSNLIVKYSLEENFSIHSTLKYVGKQFVDNANTDDNAVDSHIRMDFGFNYTKGSLTISGKVNNLLDTLYVTHGEDWGAYWPGATRNAYMELRYKF